ncbi:hypothetical protein J7T55_010676 [Diaporthe amygdali]|uniref:uncharacterized protein n=1 Tax=Phomopsis amygdali TaxID=1214568 RepID=UPI0022FE7880|nr:uncharacterized protein J7T55_010676 [Diaporthe amygdali]KAJ0114287.1 hypothetical protein J7T55_010676 [Diaporthe amygdali]
MSATQTFKILGYGHTGITVRSMSDSLRFWNDILGLPVIWNQTIPGGFTPGDPTHIITGAPAGTTMHVTWLGLPQTPHAGGSSDPSHISTLELIQYDLPADIAEEQKSRTPQTRSWDVGAAHVNLMVQGLDSILERVKTEGWFLYSGVFTIPQESPETKARGQRVCYLRGPDGEIVELTEIPKEL